MEQPIYEITIQHVTTSDFEWRFVGKESRDFALIKYRGDPSYPYRTPEEHMNAKKNINTQYDCDVLLHFGTKEIRMISNNEELKRVADWIRNNLKYNGELIFKDKNINFIDSFDLFFEGYIKIKFQTY